MHCFIMLYISVLELAPQLSCDGNINQQQPCSSSQATGLDESNQYLCPCPVGPTCCCPGELCHEGLS